MNINGSIKLQSKEPMKLNAKLKYLLLKISRKSKMSRNWKSFIKSDPIYKTYKLSIYTYRINIITDDFQ